MRAPWLVALGLVTACSSGANKAADDSAPHAQRRGPVACEGDQLLTGQRLGTEKFRPDSVDTLQYTADGTKLMSAGGSGAILWDPKTGRRTKELEAWSGKASLSADGRRIATVEFGLLDSGLRVVALDSGDTVRAWEDESSDVDRLALGPKGEHLAVTNDGAVEVRRVDKDAAPIRLGSLEGDVGALAFAPAGAVRLVAGGSKGQLRIWDVASSTQRELDTGEDATVMAVSFSADAKTLAAVDSAGVVRLYDPADGSVQHVFSATVPGEPAELRKVAVTNEGGRVVVGSWSGVYSLWSPEPSGTSASLVSVLAEGLIASGGAAFTPDGKTAVAAVHDGAIRFWDAQTGEERPQPEAGNLADVGAAAWLGDHRAVTAAGGQSANVWDLRCGKVVATLGGHTRRVAHVAASRDGALVATADEGGGVRVWDGESVQLRHEDTTNADSTTALALSQDGTWLAVARRSGLLVQNANTFDVAWQTPQSLDDNTVTALAVSPDGTVLLTGDTMGAVRWLDMSNGSSLASREEDYASNIRSIHISPDGQRVATTASDKVRVYATTTAQLQVTFSAPGWSVSKAAWFSDSARLSFGDSDGHLWVVDAQRGRVLRSTHDESLDISTVALRSDDQGLLTGHDDSSMRVWTPEEIPKSSESELEVERSPTVDAAPVLSGSTKACPAQKGGDGDALPPCAVAKLASSKFSLDYDAASDGQLALSDDGTLLATPAGEELHVVEVASGRVVSRMPCCEYGPPSVVAFSPDATSIALTPPLGETEAWNVKSGRKSHEWSFKAVAVVASPVGNLWAGVSGEGALYLVDDEGKIGEPLFPEGFSPESIVSFSADGSLLLGSDRWSILVWDTATAKPTMEDFETHGLAEKFDGIWWAGFDAKNNVVVNASTQQYVSRANGTWASKPFPLRPDGTEGVRAYRCSPDGRVCALATDEGLTVGQRGRGTSLLVKGEVEHFAVQRSGARLAVSAGEAAAVWDVESKRRLTPAPLPAAQRVAVDTQGTLVTVHDAALRIWPRGETTPSKSIEHPLQSLRLDRSGDSGVALLDDTLVRVNLVDGTKTELLPAPVGMLALSGDGMQAAVVTGEEDTILRVIDVARAEVAWQRPVAEVEAIAASKDGSKVAVAQDEIIKVYSAKKGAVTMNVEHSVYELAFSPDDTTVVAVGGGHIDVYSTHDGREVASLADGLEVDGFAFAGNSHTIVTGGSDNTVRLFDLAGKRQLGALHGHDTAILDVAAGGTPLRVVTLDARGTIFEWDVSALLED